MIARVAVVLCCALMLSGCPASSNSDYDLTDQLPGPEDSHLESAPNVEPGCPPEPPFGLAQGDKVEPLEFQDANGNGVSLHDHCGAPLTLIYHFYGW